MKKIVFVLLVFLVSISASAQLVYQKGKVYKSNDASFALPKFEVEQMMYDKSVFLYDQYKSGTAMKTTGSILVGIGLPSTTAGIILTAITYANRYYYRGYYYYDKKMYQSGWSLFGIGLGLTAIGIPIYTVGVHKIQNSVYGYNGNTTIALTFKIKDNGLGLSMAF